MYRANPGKWLSCNTIDKAEAEQFALANCPDHEAGRVTTFAEIATDFYTPGKSKWLKRQEARGIVYRVPHLVKQRGILENYLLPRFGGMDLKEITRRQIDDWLLNLKAARTRQPLQADIKNKILAAFRHIMTEAEDRGLIERNPADGIPPFRDLSRQQRRIFSTDELRQLFPTDTEKLLDIWLTTDWAAYFFLLASTGLRPGEVAALTWGDWVRSRGGLIVSASIEAITRDRKDTKTGAIKPVPLTARGTQILLWLESTREETSKDTLLFTAKDGGPLILNTIGKHFEASLTRAGIPAAGRTPYSLRHSFDTHAMKLLDTATVQELMGHKTMKMTMETYYHPTDEDRLEALPDGIGDRLGQLWD